MPVLPAGRSLGCEFHLHALQGYADYHATSVLPVLPGQSLEEALLKAGKFTPKGELDKLLQEEVGEEAQRAAWAYVGREVLERPGSPWLVM